MKGNRENLPHARELRTYEPSWSRTDVAFHAVDARVRGVLIGGKLRCHDRVAGLPAELRGIHVLDAAVRSGSEDEDVYKGCGPDDKNSVTDHGLAKIGRRINVQELSLGFELVAAHQNSDGNNQQTEGENSRQNQKEQNANIRMGRSWEQKIIKPEGHEGNRAAGGEHGADETDGILSKKVQEPHPAPDRFANGHIEVCSPYSSSGKKSILLQGEPRPGELRGCRAEARTNPMALQFVVFDIS